jgi:hypothetical protein
MKRFFAPGSVRFVKVISSTRPRSCIYTHYISNATAIDMPKHTNPAVTVAFRNVLGPNSNNTFPFFPSESTTSTLRLLIHPPLSFPASNTTTLLFGNSLATKYALDKPAIPPPRIAMRSGYEDWYRTAYCAVERRSRPCDDASCGRYGCNGDSAWDASAGRAATVFNVFCETFWSRIAGSIGHKIYWESVATTTKKLHWEVQLMFWRENVRAWTACSSAIDGYCRH